MDSGGCSSTTIGAVAYSRLMRHLGIAEGTTAVYDLGQQLAMPEQWYLDMFDVDVVDVTRDYCLDTSAWHDWRLADGSMGKIPPWTKPERADGGWVIRDSSGRIVSRMPPGGHFFDRIYWPLADADEGEYGKLDFTAPSRPLLNLYREPTFPQILAEAAKKLHESTDYAIMLNAAFVSLFETGCSLSGIDNFLADMIADRRKVVSLLDRLLELHVGTLERLLDATAPYINIIKVNDDLGMQTGPQISLRMYRELIKPGHKLLFDTIRRKAPGVFIFLHSCGSVSEFLPDLIDIGLDILNPVQTSATGMDPERLKREFGKDLTFWGGGVDTQRVLPYGTPEEVAEDVEHKMRAFAPGGGFVFTQSHNITPEVPPENILAMFDSFKEHRAYPIC